MRRYLLIVITLLVCALPAFCASVTLRWDAPNDATTASAYNIYQASTAAGPFNKVGSVQHPTVTFTVQNLSPGVYYFRATQQNMWGESAPSNTVSTPPVAGSPTNLIFVVSIAEDGTVKIRALTPAQFAAEFFRTG